jgi:DNA-binding transcriptional MerR regulator
MRVKIPVKEGGIIQEEILDLIRRKQELNEELARINRKLKEKLNLQRQVIIDYESWVKQKSIEKLGEVKASYSIREASKVTGISRSTIHHRIMEGQILTLEDKNKRIPFEEVVNLVSLYY